MSTRFRRGLATLLLSGAVTTGAGPAPIHVRAGDQIVTDVALCTGGFLLVDQHGTRYLTTAAHCIDPGDDSGVATWAPHQGPEVRTIRDRRIGAVVYSAATADSVEDFALVRLDDDVVADPSIPDLGAPSAISDGQDVGFGDEIWFYGHGQGVSDARRDRPGLITYRNDRMITAAAPAFFGDSGGPVQTADGQALGVVSGAQYGLGLHADGPTASGARFSLLAVHLPRIKTVLGIDLGLLRDQP